jgi:hypothetical protein
MRQSAQLDSNNRRCCDAFLSAMSTQLRSLPKSYMLKIPLQKSSRAAKAHRAPAGVKKPAASTSRSNCTWSASHRLASRVTVMVFATIDRRKNADSPAPRVLDPAEAKIDYADNERGAINKLLALNEHYRAHPWPEPFDRTAHRLRLGDARDLSWIPDSSVHLIVTSRLPW